MDFWWSEAKISKPLRDDERDEGWPAKIKWTIRCRYYRSVCFRPRHHFFFLSLSLSCEEKHSSRRSRSTYISSASTSQLLQLTQRYSYDVCILYIESNQNYVAGGKFLSSSHRVVLFYYYTTYYLSCCCIIVIIIISFTFL
jgi:hypothetical protein